MLKIKIQYKKILEKFKLKIVVNKLQLQKVLQILKKIN